MRRKPTNATAQAKAGNTSNSSILPKSNMLDSFFYRHFAPRSLTIADLPSIEAKRVMFKFVVVMTLAAGAIVGGCSL